MAVQYTPLQSKGIRGGGGVGGGGGAPNIMQSFLQGAQIADSFMTIYRNAKDRKVVDGYAQTGWENLTTDQQVDWGRRNPEGASIAHQMWMGKKQIENLQAIRAREAAQDRLAQSQSAREKMDAMLLAATKQSDDPFERVRVLDSLLDNLDPSDPEEAAVLEQAEMYEKLILDMTTGKRALTDERALMAHHWYGNYTKVNERYVAELKNSTAEIRARVEQEAKNKLEYYKASIPFNKFMKSLNQDIPFARGMIIWEMQKFGATEDQPYGQQEGGMSEQQLAYINNLEMILEARYGDASIATVMGDADWRMGGSSGKSFDETYGATEEQAGQQQTTDAEQPGAVTRNPTVVGDENIQVLKEGSGGYLQTRGAGMRSQVSLPTDDNAEDNPPSPFSEPAQIEQNPAGVQERVKAAVMNQSINQPDQPEAMTEWKIKNFKSGNLTISPNEQDPSRYEVRDKNNVVIDAVKLPDNVLQQINAEAGGLGGMIGQPPAQGQQPQQPQQQFDAQGVPMPPSGPPQGMSPTQAPPPQGMPTPAPPGGQPPVDLDRFNEIMQLSNQSQSPPGQMQGGGQTPMDAGQAPAASPPSAAPPQQVPPAPPSPSGPIEGTGQTPLDSGQQPAAPDIPDLEGAFKAQNAPTQYEVALDDYLGESLGTEKPEERDYFYETLKKHEGFVKTPRQTMQGKDSEGKDYPTVVGYGNALPLSKELAEAAGISEELRQKLNRGEGSVTREQASALMKAGIKENWDKSVALVKDKREFDMTTLSTNQKMALMNMAFLLGPSRLNGFKLMIEALKIGDWKEAAKQIEESDMVRKKQINKPRLRWLQKNIQIT